MQIKELETAQIKQAVSKHTTNFLQFNQTTQTLNLCSVTLGGSYINTPISTFRLHSVIRLSWPKDWKQEDTIRILFYKSNELLSLDLAASKFYKPAELIMGLAGLGVTFPSTLAPKELGKHLIDYLAKNLVFADAAALPGWAHHPTPDSPLTFLLAGNVSDQFVADPLRSMELNCTSELTASEVINRLKEAVGKSLPVEIYFFMATKLQVLLQSILCIHGVPPMPVLNLILEKNTREIRQSIADFLSLYQKPEIHMLPMSQTELKKRTLMVRDDFLFFTVPSYKLPQYQRDLLKNNIFTLQQAQSGNYIPVIFSDGYLDGINLEDALCIPMTRMLYHSIPSQILPELNQFIVLLLRYVEKNPEIFVSKIESIRKLPFRSSSNGEMQLNITRRILTTFVYAFSEISPCLCGSRLSNITDKIAVFIESCRNSDVSVGISEQFIQKLAEKISNRGIKAQKITAPFCPLNDGKDTVLIETPFICVPPTLFDDIVRETFCQIQPLTVLKALYSDGYLVADEAGSFHYKKKIKSINKSGKPQYLRFIVLKSTALNQPGRPKLF